MSDPSEILKARLSAIIQGSEDARGLHFFCQIGGTQQESGMSTLQISGTGSTLLGWRRQEDERLLYSFKLSARDQRRFYEMLLDLPFWECTIQRRPARAGEMNIHLRLSDQKAGSWSGIQLWHEDISEYDLLQTLMFRIYRFIASASDDEIPTPEWVDDLEPI